MYPNRTQTNTAPHTPPSSTAPSHRSRCPSPRGPTRRSPRNPRYKYNLLLPTGKHQPRPSHIAVRAIARALVLSVTPHGFAFAGVQADILGARPALEERFIETPAPVLGFDCYDVDFARVEEVLGIKEEDFQTQQRTFFDTVTL
ncbi:hypothetical protein BJ912DRAFT_1055744 [Pholiota molesta]|nr:hypothetical protein BJ912DRAFT_1055744 [Pholiota molesta]